MKNFFKLFGIITFVAAIGLTAFGDDTTATDGNKPATNQEQINSEQQTNINKEQQTQTNVDKQKKAVKKNKQQKKAADSKRPERSFIVFIVYVVLCFVINFIPLGAMWKFMIPIISLLTPLASFIQIRHVNDSILYIIGLVVTLGCFKIGGYEHETKDGKADKRYKKNEYVEPLPEENIPTGTFFLILLVELIIFTYFFGWDWPKIFK
ncbi:MAG: hypothetical protein FWH53_00020 [Leptospirales bacterium]|nr:hypothetical protein [Leptospirales bacterium]